MLLPSTCHVVAVIEKLRGQLVSMKKSCSGDEAFKTCVSTMIKYIGNVARSPDEDKFRSINMGNAAFQSRVASVSGAVDFFKLLGFQVGWRAELICHPALCWSTVWKLGDGLASVGGMLVSALLGGSGTCSKLALKPYCARFLSMYSRCRAHSQRPLALCHAWCVVLCRMREACW